MRDGGMKLLYLLQYILYSQTACDQRLMKHFSIPCLFSDATGILCGGLT